MDSNKFLGQSLAVTVASQPQGGRGVMNGSGTIWQWAGHDGVRTRAPLLKPCMHLPLMQHGHVLVPACGTHPPARARGAASHA
jgi:hypothetical protein